MKCPNCRGLGRLFPAIPHKGFPKSGMLCDICKGNGILPQDIDYRQDDGKILKGERFRSGRSLKEYCEKFDIDVIERSRMERGYFKK